MLSSFTASYTLIALNTQLSYQVASCLVHINMYHIHKLLAAVRNLVSHERKDSTEANSWSSSLHINMLYYACNIVIRSSDTGQNKWRSWQRKNFVVWPLLGQGITATNLPPCLKISQDPKRRSLQTQVIVRKRTRLSPSSHLMAYSSKPGILAPL